MTILNNEEVYKDKDRVIYKLYCPQKQLFGLSLQTKDGRKELHPAYKSIHRYFSNGMGVVVTPEGQYLWVDRDLMLREMSIGDEAMVSTLYTHDAVCNCVGTAETETCSLCRNGVIRNPENFRKVQYTDHLTYEYETALGAYRITLQEESSTPESCNYLWRICDLEDALREMIDEAEKNDKTCANKSLLICVAVDLGEGEEPRISLKSYRTEVEVIDVNFSLDFDSNRIYIGI